MGKDGPECGSNACVRSVPGSVYLDPVPAQIHVIYLYVNSLSDTFDQSYEARRWPGKKATAHR